MLPQHDGRFHAPGHVELIHLAPEIPLPTDSGENKDAATINAGQLVAVDASGVGFVLADNSGFGTRTYGFAVSTTAPTFSLDVQVGGILELADWTAGTGAVSLPARSRWFMGSSGLLTQTAPATAGSIVQIVGEAIAPQKMRIAIGRTLRKS